MGELGAKLEPSGAKIVTGRAKKSKSEYPKWHDAAAGGVAGAGARLLTAPLDLIKIRRQVLQTSSTSGTVSMLATAKNVIQNEGGIRALFRGNVAATYLWVGYAIVQFSLYGRMNDYLSSPNPSYMVPSKVPANLALQPPNRHFDFKERIRTPIQVWDELRCEISKRQTTVAFISGATAGVCATLTTYPFDICRSAFATQGLSQSQMVNAASSASSLAPPTSILQFSKRMLSTYGFKGFFAGCNPAIIQIVPYMGLNFALYDTFLRLQTDDKNGKVANAGFAGTIAGGVSKALVYPLDTVKKRIQAQTFSALVRQQEGAFQRQYTGMVDCIIQTGRTEGLVGFYRGMVPSVMKNAAATGLTFAFFTRTKSILEAFHDTKRASEAKGGISNN